MRSNLGYWLTLDRQSQHDELDRHQAELKAKQSQGQKGQQRLHRKRDQGLEP